MQSSKRIATKSLRLKVTRRKNVAGFTLVETLVAVNLAFLAITVIISFYLLTDKYIISFIKLHYDKQNDIQTLLRFNDLLKDSERFTFSCKQNESCFLFDNKSVFLKQKELIIEDHYSISNISGYKIELELENHKNIVITDRLQSSSDIQYNSEDISSVTIIINKNSNEYKLHYSAPKYSVKRFRNI